MIYALTADNTIRQVGALPKLWHDWRGEPSTWALT